MWEIVCNLPDSAPTASSVGVVCSRAVPASLLTVEELDLRVVVAAISIVLDKPFPNTSDALARLFDAHHIEPQRIERHQRPDINAQRALGQAVHPLRYATEAETRQMQALVHEAMKAGAFGWSSMKTLINRPDDGRFIPSQVASNEEYLALAQVLADFGVGSIGWTRGAAERPLPPGEPDLLGGATLTGSGIQMDPVEGDAPGKGREDFLIEMCLASGRPLQWGAVSQSEAAPGRYKEQLAFLERAHAEGAWMYAQTASNPPSPVFELAEYNGFDAMPNWIDPFVGTPEERIAKLNKPGVRDRMRRDVGAWAGTGGT